MKFSPATLLFVPGIIWGVSFIVVELTLPVIPPITLTLLRTIISIIALLLLLGRAKASLPHTWQDWQPFLILATVNQALPFSLTSWGQLYLPGGLASILLSVMPLFTVLLALWFTEDEPLTPHKLGGIFLGLAGIIVLIGPEVLKGLGINAVAQLALVFSAFLYATGAVYTRHVYSLQPPGLSKWALRVRIMTAQFIASGIVLMPFSLLFDKPWTLRPSWDIWLYLLFLGIGVTLFATMVYFYLIEEMGAGTAATTVYLIPVAGVLAGIVVLGEQLSPSMVIALIMILLGIFIVSRGTKKQISVSRSR